MDIENTGKVIKILAGKYWVLENNSTFLCAARGIMRRKEGIFVGDKVKFIKSPKISLITEVLERKNLLLRPPVANIDLVIIVIAKEPSPDLVLVDKILVNSYSQNILPVLCYNKVDMVSAEEANLIVNQYSSFMPTFTVSTLTGEGIGELAKHINGKTVCFAGQSAVGKTSILNSIVGLDLLTGEISKKIKKGKNTTRHIEIYPAFNGEIVDTCGFSLLENIRINQNELAYYYPDFLEYSSNCRYNGCTHITEPDCKVKEMVQNNQISKERYQRYIKIFNEIKEYRNNEF